MGNEIIGGTDRYVLQEGEGEPMSFRQAVTKGTPRKRGEKQREIVCDILTLQRFRSP